MRVKVMILAVVAMMALMPAVAMAEWGIAPTMSVDGNYGAMASFTLGSTPRAQEIMFARNIPRQQSRRSVVAKQEAESQQFFSAKEMENLTSSLQLPPPVEGRKYLKIGVRPVDPKTFDFLKEDAHILLKDTEIRTADSNSKISIGWLRAGEILVTSKGETRAIRIWRCGNPILSELYIVAPKPIPAKVEAASIPIAAAAAVETPAKQETKKQDLFPQATIDKIADNGQSSADNAKKWSTGKKVTVVAVVVAVVGAAAYAIKQNSRSTTTTTTVIVGPGPNPPS